MFAKTTFAAFGSFAALVGQSNMNAGQGQEMGAKLLWEDFSRPRYEGMSSIEVLVKGFSGYECLYSVR
jgi:hypothetical protein